MSQKRMYLGNVIPRIPDKGDERHPIYIKDSTAVVIDKVADSEHADLADEATHAANATVSDKLGTETVGDIHTPIYLNEGVATVTEKPGTNLDLMLGDGTVMSIETFLDTYIEGIRSRLGEATTGRIGLVPILLPDEDDE